MVRTRRITNTRLTYFRLPKVIRKSMAAVKRYNKAHKRKSRISRLYSRRNRANLNIRRSERIRRRNYPGKAGRA